MVSGLAPLVLQMAVGLLSRPKAAPKPRAPAKIRGNNLGPIERRRLAYNK